MLRTYTILFLFSLPLFAMEGTGLQISGSADILGQFGLNSGTGATDRLDVREAELLIYAPADHLFDGQVSLAAHGEGSIPRFELHEAYVGSSKLIPRSRFRVGQFFLGIGRLNQFHRHDWPLISAPTYHRQFFAPEGLLDTGVEYSFLFPLPIFLELTAGITNGFVYGHVHNTVGSKPVQPTHYLRLATYADLPADGGVQVGLNYLGRRGSEGIDRGFYGLDITAKWKEAKVTKFLLQSEIWYRKMRTTTDETKSLGVYVLPQYALSEDFFVTLRFDYYSVTSSPVKNYEAAVIPMLTYKPSEFSQMRLAYTHTGEYQDTSFVRTSRVVELQAVFILGAHPAHDF